MAWTDFDFTSSLIPVQAHITYNTILTILYEMGDGGRGGGGYFGKWNFLIFAQK